ncbi:MAG: hypothetical protein JO218_05350 [Burkholderiales bacterium]|nr:hypothetical protein [Burkholderiales bacterium]
MNVSEYPLLQPDLPDPLAPLFNGTLAPHVFDHRCHVFAAWAAMRRHGIEAGAERFRRALRAFVTHLGVPDKYHVTITEAFLRLVADEVRRDAAEPRWELARSRFEHRASRLMEPSKVVLASYYSDTYLQGEAARRRFLAPDLRALPQTELDPIFETTE